ncbi:MAG: hypothetical protein C4325_13130, partial [Blastocatellia bacterium]
SDSGNRRRFDERYSGTLSPGQTFVDVPFQLRQSPLDAKFNQNHGNERLGFALFDSAGNLIAIAENKSIYIDGLQPGRYFYRVSGNVSRAVDFTIKSGQGR